MSQHAHTAQTEKGSLCLVATPIGNLGDFAPRAQSVLQEADLILCEDTRTFAKLAKQFNINTKLLSYHEHNERQRLESLREALLGGQHVCLLSDAGTPLVSDPGYHLVNLAHELGVPVRTVPGPCAAIAALSVSGFEPNRFCFEGFLPTKKQKRRQLLEAALSSEMTTIFYESPHRIISTLEICASLSETIEVCIVRELTKLYEETMRGPVTEVLEAMQKRSTVKGEIVLLIRAGKKGFHYSDAPLEASSPK